MQKIIHGHNTTRIPRFFNLFPLFSYFAADNFDVQTEDISPVEFSAANVTCVAFDSTGIKVPEKIKFMMRDEIGYHYELTANENLYFTNRTENYGRWIITSDWVVSQRCLAIKLQTCRFYHE